VRETVVVEIQVARVAAWVWVMCRGPKAEALSAKVGVLSAKAGAWRQDRQQEVEREDKVGRHRCTRTRQVVTLARTSVRTQLSVPKARVSGCEWLDGDTVMMEWLPLASNKAVGEVVVVATYPSW